MKAPIPDPFEQPRQLERLPRPRALGPIIGLSLFFSFCSLFLRNHALAVSNHVSPALLWFASALTWVLPIFLWLGQNWARIFKMVFSFLTLFLVFSIVHQDPLRRLDYIGRILFALIWIWYLTRPQVIGFYKGRPIQNSPTL